MSRTLVSSNLFDPRHPDCGRPVRARDYGDAELRRTGAAEAAGDTDPEDRAELRPVADGDAVRRVARREDRGVPAAGAEWKDQKAVQMAAEWTRSERRHGEAERRVPVDQKVAEETEGRKAEAKPAAAAAARPVPMVTLPRRRRWLRRAAPPGAARRPRNGAGRSRCRRGEAVQQTSRPAARGTWAMCRVGRGRLRRCIPLSIRGAREIRFIAEERDAAVGSA